MKQDLKCILNGQFEPLKEYGRHCHRYLGKVNFFGSIGSQKFAKNAIFLQGGQNLPTAIRRVKKLNIKNSADTQLITVTLGDNDASRSPALLGLFR